MLYQVWAVWVATGKRYLPSQIMSEYMNGYGWVLDGVLDMESFYGKQVEEQRPKDKNNGR